MKIAVLMSSYQGENYIREQIDSILCQQGPFELDLWVRDDGSKDSTQNILEEYAKKNRLRWYQGENVGPARSFLDLMRHCPGYDFYAFADQDDVWMPDKLASGLERLAGIDIPAISFANAELVDGELNSLGRNVYRHAPGVDLYTVMCAANMLGCTMVFNRRIADVIIGREMPGKVTMHDSYLARVCAAIGGQIIYDEKPHMKYRQHGKNVIGMSSGRVATIKSRLHDILTRADISIAEQADVIIGLYADLIDEENMNCLLRIRSYRNSLWGRISLACSRQTRYSSRNMALKFRLSILLGNR